MDNTRRLLGYLRPYRLLLAAGLFSILILSSVQVALPLVLGRGLFDHLLLEEASLQYLTYFALLIFFLFFIKGGFTYAAVYSMAYVSQRVAVDLRNGVFEQLHSLTLAYHQEHRTGEAVSRVVSDVGLIQASLVNGLGDIWRDGLVAAGLIVMLLMLHWKLALVAMFTLPVLMYVANLYGTRLRRLSRAVQERVANLSSILQENILGIRIIQAFNMEEQEQARFFHENDRSLAVGMRSAKLNALVWPVAELLLVGGMLVVVWYGSREVVGGRLTPGELVSFLGYIGMASQPVSSLTRAFGIWQQGLGATDRVFELLDEEPAVQEPLHPIPLGRVKGQVTYEQVSFAYVTGQPVIEDIDLVVEPGEIIALVGPSGAGKTSMVNLLPRFYDPVKGTVRIDGIDIKQVRLKELRSQIGLVPQETILFGVSVRENILHGRPGASDEEVVAAAKTANAHDFIRELPAGYDTVIGERGTTLSGGQRQRLAIARVVLKAPRLLILDEATSALDTESEQLVQEALSRLMQNRTTFIIAHRLSTIRNAHRIVVIDGGKIAENGSHAKLMEKQGLYWRLYTSQFHQEEMQALQASKT